MKNVAMVRFPTRVVLMVRFVLAAGLLAVATSHALSANLAAGPGESQVLFDARVGSLGDSWKPLAQAGGDFGKFAHFEDAMLVAEVPAGHSWGKTGIHTLSPILQAPSLGSEEASTLTLTIDPERSAAFVVSLLPAGRNPAAEWWEHDIRVGWDGRSGDGDLWVRREKKDHFHAMDGKPPSHLSIVLRPDQIVLVTDGDGHILMQALLPDEIAYPQEGYNLAILAHAPVEGESAGLALCRLESGHLSVQHLRDPALWPVTESEAVLFDGRLLGNAWTPYSAHGGDYARCARLGEHGLEVSVPAGSSWGKTGLMSPEPVVWLDEFGPDAEVRVVFEFEPSKTTGFVIALTPFYGLNGNDPDNNQVSLHWRRTADGDVGKASFKVFPDAGWDPLWEVVTPPDAPSRIALVLTPQGVHVEAPELPDTEQSWSMMRLGQGLRVYVFTHPDQVNQPVKMMLKQIRLVHRTGENLPPPRPLRGVAPLPEKVLFAGEPGDWWDATGVNGAGFPQNVHFVNHTMEVDISPGLYWGKAGLLSKEPVLFMDGRIARTPYRLTIEVDPKRTSGLQVMFNTYHAASMWNSDMLGSVSFVRHERGRLAGHYSLNLRAGIGPYHNWTRTLDADWVEEHWDGSLQIDAGDGWMRVGLSGAPVLAGNGFLIGRGTRSYAAVYAHPEDRNGGSHLVLKRIRAGWVTPDAMGPLQRWSLLDDDAFDPNAFINDLAVEVERLPVQSPVPEEVAR